MMFNRPKGPLIKHIHARDGTSVAPVTLSVMCSIEIRTSHSYSVEILETYLSHNVVGLCRLVL